MNRFAAIVLLLATSASAGNMLQNAGFEARLGDMPTGWHVYVEPQEGSSAKFDAAEAHEGQWSAQLRNEFPYTEEPANNWSQNVLEPLAKSVVTLSGWIKTEDATEAAIWIQCFRKDPWEVLLQASTSTATPMSGTNPWTEVTTEATVPEGTDFCVVRCVLKGTGAAWYDDIALEVKEKPQSASPAAEKPVAAPKAPKAPTMPHVPQAPSPAPKLNSDVPREEIVAAHEAVRDANEALRQSNEALAEQLKAMREQMESLRQQIREAGDAAKNTIAEGKAAPAVPAPPLIPHVPEQQQKDSP